MTTLILPADNETAWGTKLRTAMTTTINVADGAAATAASAVQAASPALTGVPTAPTASGGTNTTQLATTAFVAAAVTGLAPLASPALTGTPAAPTATPGDSTTKIATTAFVAAAAALLAPLASPALTGTPTAPTAAPGTNTTQIASTAFAAAADALKAPLASPTFTGTPTFPAGTIARAALDSSTATSLGKADSALQTNAVASVAGRTGAVTLTDADLTNATTVGKAVIEAASQAAGRTALGAGTSSVAIGTSSGTALDAATPIPLAAAPAGFLKMIVEVSGSYPARHSRTDIPAYYLGADTPTDAIANDIHGIPS